MGCIAFSTAGVQCAAMLAKQIGGHIKAARKAKGWSLETLAAKVSPPTSYQQISRLEKGSRALTVQWIERIATAMRVDQISLIAPDKGPSLPSFHLDEQVADEIARTLAVVALQGAEPGDGTVQVLSLMLQELSATFVAHPQAASDPQIALPVIDLASRRFAPVAS